MTTRFRAYKLGSAGSLCSFFDGKKFTLIEARYNDDVKGNIDNELKECGLDCKIDVLHISSWDADHCVPGQLEEIIIKYSPGLIEAPEYKPDTDSGKESLEIIDRMGIKCNRIGPEYISGLESAKSKGDRDVIYWPKEMSSDCNNDNSIIKLFRMGCFNVLSLGDVESVDVSNILSNDSILKEEVDVMIASHHGADNGFTNERLMRSVNPECVVYTSNFGNQFDHPREEVRAVVSKFCENQFTTKTGDVLIVGEGSKMQMNNITGGSVAVRSASIKKRNWWRSARIRNERARIPYPRMNN